MIIIIQFSRNICICRINKISFLFHDHDKMDFIDTFVLLRVSN